MVRLDHHLCIPGIPARERKAPLRVNHLPHGKRSRPGLRQPIVSLLKSKIHFCPISQPAHSDLADFCLSAHSNVSDCAEADGGWPCWQECERRSHRACQRPSRAVSEAILAGHLLGCRAAGTGQAHRADAAGDGGEGGGLGRGVPGRLEHLLAAALAALQRAVVQQRAQDALYLPRAQLQPRHPLRRQHSDPG